MLRRAITPPRLESVGEPFISYDRRCHLPGSEKRLESADRELLDVTRLLKTSAPSQQRDQVALFLMMSYAEKLSPGSIDRGSHK